MPAHRPHSPWASPVMTPSITATLDGWAPQARPRRGGNTAHSSVEPLMITSSGKPFISLLSSQKKIRSEKPASTLGGLWFYFL